VSQGLGFLKICSQLVVAVQEQADDYITQVLQEVPTVCYLSTCVKAIGPAYCH